MHYLFILNDPPYGTERSYNGLRLATTLTKSEGTAVSVFLTGDAAACAVAGQKTPDGYYNLERMLKIMKSKGAKIGVCGTCMDGRGIKLEMLVEGAHRSTMEELAVWTAAADRVLVSDADGGRRVDKVADVVFPPGINVVLNWQTELPK